MPDQATQVGSSRLVVRVLKFNTLEIHFLIKPTMPMRKLKVKFLTQLRMPAQNLCFMFRGHIIGDYDTAASLGIDHLGLIEVYRMPFVPLPDANYRLSPLC